MVKLTGFNFQYLIHLSVYTCMYMYSVIMYNKQYDCVFKLLALSQVLNESKTFIFIISELKLLLI